MLHWAPQIMYATVCEGTQAALWIGPHDNELGFLPTTVRKWRFLPAACEWSILELNPQALVKPSDIYSPAGILTAVSWQALGNIQPAKPLPDSLTHKEYEIIYVDFLNHSVLE